MKNLLVTLAMLAGFTALYAVDDGSVWPQKNGDSYWQNRIEVPGNITEPEVLWQWSTGGGYDDTRLKCGGTITDAGFYCIAVRGGHLLRLNNAGTIVWDSGNINASQILGLPDFDLDGTPEILVSGNDQVRIFAFGSGTQLFSAPLNNYTVKVANIDGDPELELLMRNQWGKQGIRAFDFSGGISSGVLKWSFSNPQAPGAGFGIAVGDINGVPATKEIVFHGTGRGDIYVIDAGSGSQLYRRPAPLYFGNWSYGQQKIVNLDGDPQNEYLFTGNYSGRTDNGAIQITVYDYVQNAIQWSYEFGRNTTGVLLEALPDSVVDLDGDGIPEVAVSVYNNTLELTTVNGIETPAQADGINKPNAWITIVYRGADGAVIASLDNRKILGTADMDGDGVADILVRETVVGTPNVAQFGTVEGYKLGKSGLGRILRNTYVAPVMCLPDLPDNAYNMNNIKSWCDIPQAGGAALAVMVDGNRDGFADSFSLLKRLGYTITVASIEGENFSFIHEANGLVTASRNAGLIETYRPGKPGKPAEVLGSWSYPTARGNAVVMRSGAEPRVLAADGRGRQVMLDPAVSSGPTELFALNNTVSQELFSFDRDGDGRYEFIRRTLSAGGDPALELRSDTGALLWTVNFPDASGQPWGFISGRFADMYRSDIVFTYLTKANQMWAALLRSDTGAIMGTHDISNVTGNTNVELHAAPDIDGDGLIEIFALQFDGNSEIVDGASLTRSSTIQTGYSSNGGVMTDLDGDGTVDVFANTIVDRKKVLALDGTVIWEFAIPAGTSLDRYGTQGISHIDDIPGYDLVLAGKFGDVSAFSGHAGLPLWKRCVANGSSGEILFDRPVVASDCSGLSLSVPAVGDIDGDGFDEIVYGSPDGYLYALNAEDGTLAWSHYFGYAVGNPIPADVDDDGYIEIVVGVADGYLYAIDGPQATVEEQVVSSDPAPKDKSLLQKNKNLFK